MTLRSVALVGIAAFSTVVAQAAPEHPRDHHVGTAHHDTGTDGSPGKASEVSRTVRVEARDTAFNVNEVRVKAGETIKFVVTNTGEIRHEFAIASPKEHEEHRAMMQEMPDMVHEDANAITIEPGATKDLIWTFGKTTEVEFACDLPGHAEQGMTGSFRLMR
jgi:uncharacterized cupredoxin-like copper-binding protein